MPKLPSLFESFDNLDQILPEDIASSLRPVPQLTQLEDYLANRILYPQAIPQTAFDMQIDLSILREALAMNGPKPGVDKNNTLLGSNPFLNITLRKLLIPAKFLNFAPNLAQLIQVFIDALLLDRKKEDWFEDLWTIVLTDDTDEIVGSIILTQFDGSGGVMELSVLNKNYQIRQGSLMVISCPRDRCEISYKLRGGHVLGKTESAIEVYGGRLGVMVDGRDS